MKIKLKMASNLFVHNYKIAMIKINIVVNAIHPMILIT